MRLFAARRTVLFVTITGAAFAVVRAQGPSSESRSVWDGVYTAEQAKRGEAVYRKECASCHGASLTGGESAPPLTGGAFLSNWNGLTLGDLFDRIRKTMPQTTPGKLSRQQNADVLAFTLSANKFPAGKAELSQKTEFLKEIRFEAMKPEPSNRSRFECLREFSKGRASFEWRSKHENQEADDPGRHRGGGSGWIRSRLCREAPPAADFERPL